MCMQKACFVELPYSGITMAGIANFCPKIMMPFISEKFSMQIKVDFWLGVIPKLYIPSTPNNSYETHTFMCLGRTGRFGQH